MLNVFWKALIVVSVFSVTVPILKILIIITNGGGFSFGFYDLAQGLPVCVMSLIVANFIKPVSLFNSWLGKALSALAIFFSVLMFVSSALLSLDSYMLSEGLLPISNTFFQIATSLGAQAFIVLVCSIPFIFKVNLESDIALEETFS